MLLHFLRYRKYFQHKTLVPWNGVFCWILKSLQLGKDSLNNTKLDPHVVRITNDWRVKKAENYAVNAGVFFSTAETGTVACNLELHYSSCYAENGPTMSDLLTHKKYGSQIT